MKYTLLLLLLGGCAVPVDQLHRTAQECGPSEACKPLWDSYFKKAEQQERMLRERNMKCPNGMIMVVDGKRRGCMTKSQLDNWRMGY